MDIVGTLTAPARLGFRIAVTGARTLFRLLPVGGRDEPDATGPTVERPPSPAPSARPRPPVVGVETPPEDVETPPEPRHVDEGATVVGEFAEAGAEDGAGAGVELAEPWEGYDRMQAEELLPRLSEVSTETLAAVSLYERSTRGRASVMEEAELQLRRRTGQGARH